MRHPRPHVKTLLSILTLSASIGFTSTEAIAQQHNHNHDHGHGHSADHGQVKAINNSAAQRKAAFESTYSFVMAQKEWAQARGASNKQAALEKLIAKAEARREMLAELIRTNPAEALRVAIPEEKQLGMPEEVQAMLEQRFVAEGELEVVIEDYEKHSKQRTILKTPFGERFEIHSADKGRELLSGSKANISGLLLEGENNTVGTVGDIAVSDNPDDLLTLAADGGSTGGSNGGTAALPNTFGEQKVLVMLVNFQDKTTQPWSRATIEDRFITIDQFIQENSYQQTWLNTDVTNWMTLPLSASATCNYDELAALADQQATNAGINIGNYNRLVYMFPENSCPYIGLGTVGGAPSRAWIKRDASWETIAHELGHNFGLYHSHDLVCAGKSVGDMATLGSECSSREYGDYADIMGAWMPGHFNTYQKDRLGWLGNKVQTITADGTYTLSPQEESGNNPLALKVLRGIDPNSGREWWYYLEMRKAVGFDSSLPTWENNFLNGITVHMGTPEYGNSNFLLDMKPETYDHLLDGALEPGYTFVDSDTGIRIRTDSFSSNNAQVTIETSGTAPVCTNSNPTISATPEQSQWVAAGTQVTYQVTVTNNDSAACNSSNFALSATQLSGWNNSFANNALTLAPGQSASTTLSVTSASSATDGFYTLTLNAANGSYQASSDVTYVISNPVSNSAPVAINDSAATESGTTVVIPVLSNDSDPDGDSLNITAFSGVNGTITDNGNGTVSFTPPTSFTGTEYFNYTISDGQGGSDSATVTVNVAAKPAQNSAPTAGNDSATTEENTAVTIPVLSNDSDPDGDSLSITSFNGVDGNVVNNGNGSITFTPETGFIGTETFTYTVSDGNGGSSTATVSVTVNEAYVENQAPIAVNDSVTLTSKDSITIAVLANDSDPEGDTLLLASVTTAAKGTVIKNSDGTITYIPGSRFKNSDSFSYTVSDGEKTATATVSIQLQKSTGGKGNGKNR